MDFCGIRELYSSVSGRSRVPGAASQGLRPLMLQIPAVELLQQLVPSDVWNIYAPAIISVSWAHTATVWEERDHHAYMRNALNIVPI